MGRLGTLFGYERFGVEPDIMTLAKGLGGGVPIGAFMAKDEACAFDPGDHGSTFGGNALTCAAGYASTKYIIDNDLPGHATEMESHMAAGLASLESKYDQIQEVRGMGLLWAVIFESDIGPDVVANCNAEGLLTNPLRPNAVRLMPPLTVSKEEIDQAMERLDAAIGAVA
jgi:acetylornithine/succinyldiaminopimelate/putrescine aminotransferase